MSDGKTVIQALTDVMRALGPIGKSGHNEKQNYDFRGIDAVVNAVGPLLREHGVLIVPHTVEANYRDVETSTGKPSRECTVKTTYRAFGPMGDWIDMQVPGESMDSGDKGTPKAMSVAFRILLLQAFSIPTGDPDPDSQSYERAAMAAPQRVTDTVWLAEFETKIPLAGSRDDWSVLDRERRAKYEARALSDDDWTLLERQMKERADEIRGTVGASA